MVPATEGGGLESRVEQVVGRVPGPNGQTLRVIERPGPAIKQLLTRNNPFPREGCQSVGCPLGGLECAEKCYKESVAYDIRCRRCTDPEVPSKIYIGESARSLFTRMGGHIGDLKSHMKSQSHKSWMGEHVREAHGGSWNKESPHEEWEFSLEGNFRKPLDREVNEFIRIRRAKCSGQARIQGERTKVAREVFNSKEEWYSHVSQWDIVW